MARSNDQRLTVHRPPLILVVVRFDSLITIGCRLWTVDKFLGNGTQQTVIVDAKRCVTRIGCRLSTVDRCQNSPLSKLKLINENFVDNPMNLIYI